MRVADERKFILLSSSDGQGEIASDNGIIQGHAYALLTIMEFTHEGNLVRLLKLRNPWGKGEWTGDWSDKSEKWTQELRDKFNIVDSDDGTFCMPYDAYL